MTNACETKTAMQPISNITQTTQCLSTINYTFVMKSCENILSRLNESLRKATTILHLHTISAALHKGKLRFDIDNNSANPIIRELAGLTFFSDYEKSENKEGRLPALGNTPFMIP